MGKIDIWEYLDKSTYDFYDGDKSHKKSKCITCGKAIRASSMKLAAHKRSGGCFGQSDSERKMFILHAQEQKHKIKIAGDSGVLDGDDKVSDGKRGSVRPGLARLLETLSKQEESEQDSQQNPEVDDAVAFRASNAANSTLEILTADPPLADKTIVPIAAATLPANLLVSQNQQANAINDIDQPTIPSNQLPPISSRTRSRSKPVAASSRTIKPKTHSTASVQRVQDPPTQSLQNPFKKIKSEEIKSEVRDEIVENTDQVLRTLMDFVIKSGTPFSATQSPKFTDLIELIRSNDVKNQIALIENFPERLLNERYEKIMGNLNNVIAGCEYYSILSYGWSQPENDVVIFAILPSGWKKPVFYKAIDVSKMPKTDEKISESIIAVVNSLDVQKLSAITTDTSLNMRNAWTVIENEFKHVFVGGCALTELDLLLKALVEIPAYAAVLKDVEFVARGIWECESVYSSYIGSVSQQNQLPMKIPSCKNPKSYFDFLVRFSASKLVIREILKDNNVDNLSQTLKNVVENTAFWNGIRDTLNVLTFPVTLFAKLESLELCGYVDVNTGLKELCERMKSLETVLVSSSVVSELVRSKLSIMSSKSMQIADLLDTTGNSGALGADLASSNREAVSLFAGKLESKDLRNQVQKFRKEINDVGNLSENPLQYWRTLGKEKFPNLAPHAIRLFSSLSCTKSTKPYYESFLKVHDQNHGSAFEHIQKISFVYLNDAEDILRKGLKRKLLVNESHGWESETEFEVVEEGFV